MALGQQTDVSPADPLERALEFAGVGKFAGLARHTLKMGNRSQRYVERAVGKASRFDRVGQHLVQIVADGDRLGHRTAVSPTAQTIQLAIGVVVAERLVELVDSLPRCVGGIVGGFLIRRPEYQLEDRAHLRLGVIELSKLAGRRWHWRASRRQGQGEYEPEDDPRIPLNNRR